MPTPLNVYTYIPVSHTASFYYRLHVPIKAMTDLGLPVKVMVDSDSTRISATERVHAFCESDIALMYQPVGEPPYNNVRQVQSFIPSKRDGEWKWPPSVVVESDDNLFHVSPLNPAFANLGTKAPDGTPIPPGNNIGVVQNGQKVVKWIDGHQCGPECGNCGKGINLARNHENLNFYRRILNVADALTCSTQAVADAVKREAFPRRVRVFPNTVRFEDYEQVDLAPHPGEVRIMWQGGQNHYEDWYPLRKQLGNITRKYPQVRWVIWGVLYHWVMEEIPAERYTFKNWVPYGNYRDRLAMVGHDINLAPLSDNPFNACRSAIKWYESSVLRNPPATLAQNTAAYKAEIQDGETGLLFRTPEEFEEKLSRLIEDETERRRLGQNAKQWMSENRDAMKLAPDIFEFWEEMREDRKREQPHVTDREWAKILAQSEAEEQAAMAAQNDEPERKNIRYNSTNGTVEEQHVHAVND